MHRAGTSALTRVFNLLGADLPKTLLGSNFSNTTGHWESIDFLTIHQDLLSSAGSKWDDWREFNPNWDASPIAETFKQKLLDQLQIDFGESKFFVVKDPRICRFVPVWLDVLDRFGAHTRAIIPIRSPIEVAASLKQRDGFPLAKSYLLWLRHVLDAELATRHIPRALVTYDLLVDDWRRVIATISIRTRLRWPRRSDEAERGIDRFLVGELRHHVADPGQLDVRADIIDWVKGAYRILTEMAGGREKKVQRDGLDKIRAEFNKASAAFGLVLADEVEELDRKRQRAAEELNNIAIVLEQTKSIASQTEHERNRLAVRLEETQADAAQTEQERNRLAVRLEETQADAAQTKQEASRLSNELGATRAAVDARNAEVSRISYELEATRRLLRDSQTETQRIADALDEFHLKFDLRGQQIDELSAELQLANAKSAQVEEELARLNLELVDTRRGISERWGNMVALENDLNSARARIDDLRATIRGLRRHLDLASQPARGGLAKLWRAVANRYWRAKEQHALEWEFNLIRNSQMFDPQWYAERYPDVAAEGFDPLWHYLLHGAKEHRDPHPEFDSEWYLSQISDLAELNLTPLGHYVSIGVVKGLAPHPNKQIGVKPDASALLLTQKTTSSENLAYNTLKDSGLFDSSYYLQKNPLVAASGVDPLKHFLMRGAFERRNPNPWFHSKWYCLHYPDIAKIDNPLLHYLLHGAKEGRDPSPWFNTIEYLLGHPGVIEANINPLAHYIASGTVAVPDSLQSRLILQNNADRAVQSLELTDLIDFPPRNVSSSETSYDPSSLDIHWIIPDFSPGGGGHMTIFRIVRLLEQFGHRCTVWIARPCANRNERSASEIVMQHYQIVNANIKFLSSEFFSHGGDALICTSWETVIFGMHATGFKDRLYFVQDYEPAFFPAGAHSLAAEWTYKSGMGCICAGPWLAEKLEEMYGGWIRSGWLAADSQIYRPHDGTRIPADVPRIAFYARRHTERRAVDLGLLAFEYLAKKGVTFHVEFYGMKLHIGHLPYSFTDNGSLSETELAELYRRSDVGIVFSSTNYSLVPQEMMASGLAVLELNSESTRRIFPKDIVTLAGPHPIDIADKLEALLRDVDRRGHQASAALTWVHQFSWEQFARVVESAILERLPEKGFSILTGISAPSITKQTPKASVLIPTYNGGELFRQVLRTILAQRAPWPFEVIVIDSGSNDGTGEFAAENKGIIFRSIPKSEFHHGRTRNLGVQMASGEYVSIVTQDALPLDEFWLYNMITVMDKYPRAAGAFGRHVAYADAAPFIKRDIAKHFASFDTHPLAVSKYTKFKNWVDRDVGWRQMLHYYSDNNSCLRKSVWNTIPYPNIEYGEDQVWAARIIEAGYEKLYVAQAAVYHSHNYTPEELFEVSRQRARFFKRYFGYDSAPTKALLDAEIVKLNASDEKWATANTIKKEFIALQRELNAAKVRGAWTGMVSTAYIGYERDPDPTAIAAE